MRYFRAYPWGMQLLLFLLMIVTMMGFGSFLVLKFLPQFTPYSVTQLEKLDPSSPSSLISTSLVIQGVLSAFVFLVPAGVFAYLAHPRPKEYLGLRPPANSMHILLSVLLMLGAMPLLQLIQEIVGNFNFGEKIKAAQAASENMFNAYLVMPDTGAFIRAFIVMAIIPAVGEEMFFRGVLLRLARKRTRTMVFPIIFTAVIFSYSHTNIYGFLSICLAGVLLAVIYDLTGSLWCGIVAHMVFNGFQVVLAYIGGSNKAVKAFMSDTSVPIVYVFAGAVVFAVSLFLLVRSRRPLPPDWTDDFKGEPKDTDWDIMSQN